jgi:hypothetical protein
MFMDNKIVYFPFASAERRIARIKADKSANLTEALIAIWLCGWAMLTAAECIRQISSLAI